MKRLSLFLALGPVCACWAIDIPHIGYARDAQGLIRPIDGVSGNFLVGGPLTSDAGLAFAWNGIFGIRKTRASIEWWDSIGAKVATVEAPGSSAIIGFDRSNSQTAWIYSKAAQTLCAVTPNQSGTGLGMIQVPVRLSMAEEVLALAGGLHSVDIALRRGNGIFVTTFDQASGARISETALSVPAASRVLLLQDGSILGVTAATVWLNRADGSHWSDDSGFELEELNPMGREWFQLIGADRQMALRIRAGSDPVLYTIPGQPAAVTR